MKNLLLSAFFILFLFSYSSMNAQVGIGTTTPDPSSILEVESDSQGVLIPRMRTQERMAIPDPANSLLVFDKDSNSFWYFTGGMWNEVGASHQMIMPKGEISYYNHEGFPVGINAITPLNESQYGNKHTMTKINAPQGTTHFVNDNFGIGDNSRLTYTGAHPKYFHIALSFSYTPDSGSSNNPPTDTYVFGVAKNGVVQDSSKLFITTSFKGRYESTAMHILLKLETNDYIEFYVGNVTTSNDLRINAFNFVAVGM